MSLRTWWESRAESTPTDYTSLRIADATARVSGEQGARGTAVFRACQGLIGRSAAAATLEGEFSESLGPRLSEIARALTDCGESTWEIRLGPDGLTLLPCKISSVTGGGDPVTWHYSLIRSGPTENIVIERPAEAVLSFRVNAETGTPYRGVAPLEIANSTGALLAELELQLAREAGVKPTRIVTAGGVKLQASDIEKSIQRGGIVSILQAGATVSTTDPSGLRAGVLKKRVVSGGCCAFRAITAGNLRRAGRSRRACFERRRRGGGKRTISVFRFFDNSATFGGSKNRVGGENSAVDVRPGRLAGKRRNRAGAGLGLTFSGFRQPG